MVTLSAILLAGSGLAARASDPIDPAADTAGRLSCAFTLCS